MPGADEFAWSCLATIDRLNRLRDSLRAEAAFLERDVGPDDPRLVEIGVAFTWLTGAVEQLWRRLRLARDSGIVPPAGRSRRSRGGRGSFAPTPGPDSDDDDHRG